ncbi:VOC family protein [Sphingomonas sp. LaA6.9]|uniref:VOC family protein n=1 Tax=Sphingomonas sp. LaA6.9 TaxID=2919914 RepID=UPI001F4F23CF|nr:VOC family protein [Sphingomonas sp. LaA6.9]MCJ8156503.1 VOC family protein [Sphingomonas sp. LaA6.9]
MIGYATVGTNNPEKALAFYDALLGDLGAKRAMEFEQNNFTMYGVAFDKPMLAVTRPYDGNPATVGNGGMVALVVDERAKVDNLHAHALALGGTCEGPPGVRGEEGDQAFYGAYFRDLDGNKLCAFCVGPA